MTTTNRRLLIAANRPVDILRKFTFDRTGGNANINTCNAFIKRMKGSTIVWNQLTIINSNNQSKTENDVTFTDNRDGSYTVSTTTSGAAATTRLNMLSRNVVNGHKYLIKGCPKNGSSSSYYLHVGSFGDDIGNGLIFTSNREYPSFSFPRISVFTGYVISTPIVFRPIMFDLTLMFGAGNEPATVAEFEAMFPLDYYDYNAGQLLSFTGDDIKTTGFNQWDEQWELGQYNINSGAKLTDANNIRSKGFIRVIGGLSYYGKCPTQLRVCTYDANLNFLGVVVGGFNNTAITFDNKVAYITISTLAGTSTSPIKTYNNDICINLSHNGTKNGTYEEYEQHTKDISFYKSIKDGQGNTLFPYGLLSAGSVYDEVTATKAIKRIGAVDLGTLDWTIVTTGTYNRFYSNGIASKVKTVSYYELPNIITANYKTVNFDIIYRANNDKSCSITDSSSGARGNVNIVDSQYSTAAAFKTAMQGVMLYYELAEPIEVDIDEQNLEYPAYRTGTEELLPANGAVPTTTPTLFDIRYKIGGRRN